MKGSTTIQTPSGRVLVDEYGHITHADYPGEYLIGNWPHVQDLIAWEDEKNWSQGQ